MSNQKASVPLLISPREAAKLLSVSQRKLWAMTFEDEPALPHLKMGRLVRYSMTELQRWIEAQQQKGGSDAR
ncbi:helix-turn-helix domain-containing protein [Bremerella sp. JC817]|uniref:helix-turn-helix domain-containing protein n=1 Tax=Bremerella sp. JC817 TaxID=3231756 RepID=UPI0034574851